MGGGLTLRSLLLLGLVLLAGVCGAHPTSIASALAKVGVDGSVALRVRFDVLAFVLEETPTDVDDGSMQALLNTPLPTLQSRLNEARVRFLQGLKVGPNGKVLEATFPTAAEIHHWRETYGMKQLPVMMTVFISAQMPADSRSISIRFAEALDTVVLTTELPYREQVSEPVEPGMASTALAMPAKPAIVAPAAPVTPKLEFKPIAPVKPPPAKAPTVAKGVAPKAAAKDVVASSNKAPVEPLPSPAVVSAPAVQQPVVEDTRSWGSVLVSYVRLGFKHILPEGLDHVLFVLGLFLLSAKTKDLLKQITAFTIAHSVTLAMAMLGIVRLPSAVVEPIIALSIAFVAIENILAKEMKPWRVYVVFGFGVVHGLGFAAVLQDAGLQSSDFLTALLGFNVGVELGQLTVVAAAVLLVGWFRSSERYRAFVTVPASAAIALVAVMWTVQRLI